MHARCCCQNAALSQRAIGNLCATFTCSVGITACHSSMYGSLKALDKDWSIVEAWSELVGLQCIPGVLSFSKKGHKKRLPNDANMANCA